MYIGLLAPLRAPAMGVYKLSATFHVGKRKGPGRKERENCRLSWRDALGTSSHTELVSPRIAALLSPSPRGRLLRLAEGGDVAGGGAPVQAARSSSAGRMWEQVEARPVRELAADVGGLRPGEAGGELVAAAWSATCAGVARLTHKSSPCGQLHLGGGGEVGGGARHRHGRPSPGMGGEAGGRECRTGELTVVVERTARGWRDRRGKPRSAKPLTKVGGHRGGLAIVDWWEE
jgi:hypothetical protein